MRVLMKSFGMSCSMDKYDNIKEATVVIEKWRKEYHSFSETTL